MSSKWYKHSLSATFQNLVSLKIRELISSNALLDLVVSSAAFTAILLWRYPQIQFYQVLGTAICIAMPLWQYLPLRIRQALSSALLVYIVLTASDPKEMLMVIVIAIAVNILTTTK